MKKYFLLILAGFSLYSICQAQVPVSKEPRHHNIFENGHVRILDVHIPPGDTTQIHIHATPSVFLILTNEVKVGSQVISEEKRAKLTTPDDDNIWFEGFYIQPRIHRVWNSDTTEYHVMDIELTNKSYITIDPPIQQEAFTFLFEEKPVRGYRVKLGPAMKISLPVRKADILLVQLTGSVNNITVNEKFFHKKGDFIYIPSGNKIHFNNAGTDKSEFAFFELK
jgi:redox-sensitive bicupin YhaK (pirin superfamily)